MHCLFFSFGLAQKPPCFSKIQTAFLLLLSHRCSLGNFLLLLPLFPQLSPLSLSFIMALEVPHGTLQKLCSSFLVMVPYFLTSITPKHTKILPVPVKIQLHKLFPICFSLTPSLAYFQNEIFPIRTEIFQGYSFPIDDLTFVTIQNTIYKTIVSRGSFQYPSLNSKLDNEITLLS